MPLSRKKPRGRAFGKGADNPACHRSERPKSDPKNDANSLLRLLVDCEEYKALVGDYDPAKSFERKDES